jgi:cell shape-determining protein MreC
MWEYLPVKKGDIVADERGVWGRVRRVCMVSHTNGVLSDWSVKVEFSGDWSRILGPMELSVWRDGDWVKL